MVGLIAFLKLGYFDVMCVYVWIEWFLLLFGLDFWWF